MMYQVAYYCLLLLLLPLFPYFMWVAKRLKATLPKLPPAAEPQQTIGQGDHTLHLLAVGESSMAGLGVDNHRSSLAGYTAQYLAKVWEVKVQFQVIARNGYTAERVAHKLLQKEEVNHTPDVILVALGGNDTFRFHSPKRWIKGCAATVQRLHAAYPNAAIVFAQLPFIKFFPAFPPLLQWGTNLLLQLHHRALKHWVAAQPNVYFNAERLTMDEWIDRADGVNDRSAFYSDGIHPSELTYRIWGDTMGEYIVDNLASLPTSLQ